MDNTFISPHVLSNITNHKPKLEDKHLRKTKKKSIKYHILPMCNMSPYDVEWFPN